MMKILLVEDNVSDIRLIERTLTKYQKMTLTVSDGSQPIILKNHDLIILDLNLPIRTGLEILKEIKSSDPCIPVVIFTTSKSLRDIEHCCKEGANAYVQKPYGYSDFTQCIDDIYNFWRHHG